MSKAFVRSFYVSTLLLLVTCLVTVAVAQQLTPGNIVVAVSGCGVTNANGGTCSPSGGTGATTGTGSGYGDDQGTPWTLWEYSVSGTTSATFQTSVSLPQNISGANYPVSDDYGSQSEGTLQLSGNGAYLTMMGIGLNAAEFNNNATLFCPPGYTDPPGYNFSTCDPENGNAAMAQTGSLTGQTYSGNVPVPRVGVLIDSNGNVNSSTVMYNIFSQNDPRSAYTTGIPAGSPPQLPIYLSGQGCKAWDPSDNLCDGGNYDDTSGVYLSNVGANNYLGTNNPTAITGPDNGPSTSFTGTISSSNTTVTGPAGSFSCTPSCASSPNIGASISDSLGYYSSSATIASVQSTSMATTSKKPSTSSSSDTSTLGCTPATPCNSASSTRMVQVDNNTLYVSMDDKPGGSGYNRSYIGTLGDPPATSLYLCASGSNTCPSDDGPYGPSNMSGFGNNGGTGKVTITTGANSNGNNLNAGLNINLSPSNFFFANATTLYVADTGFPKNDSNGPDGICTSMGGTSKATVGDGGLQKWVNVSGTWTLEYTLYKGLNNGAGVVYNTDCNPNQQVTPGTPNAASGLYGLTGVVNGSTVNLYATNYATDDLIQTYLYGITDTLSYTTASQASGESFTVLDTAPVGSLFRGVSFAPSIPSGNVEVTAAVSGTGPAAGPSGLTVTSAGTDCAASTFITPLTLNWTGATSCTLSVTSPQAQSGQQYVFSNWQDGTTSTTDTITSPTTGAVYTATFTAQPSAIYSPANNSTLTGTSATFQWGGYPGATAFWLDVGQEQGGHEYYSSGSFSNATFSQTVNSLPTNGSMVYVTWYYLLYGSWVPNYYTYATFGGTSGAATMASPTPSSTLSGSSVTFTWNTATDSPQNYWLDVGSTAGAHDIYSSGDIPTTTTSQAVSGLPTNGNTIYVTLYTETGGAWVNNAYTYTAVGGTSGAATMASPNPSSTLNGSSATFTWNAATDSPQNYWLDVGSTAGAHDIYSSGDIPTTTTSQAVNGIPTNGNTIYVTLYTETGGVWVNNAYTYTEFNATSGLATIQSPTPGATLSGTQATFSWSADSNATEYWVDVGTTPGAHDLDSSGSISTTPPLQYTVYNLPATNPATTIYVTLYSLVGGQWYSTSATYSSGP
jgi:hypothetical protein